MSGSRQRVTDDQILKELCFDDDNYEEVQFENLEFDIPERIYRPGVDRLMAGEEDNYLEQIGDISECDHADWEFSGPIEEGLEELLGDNLSSNSIDFSAVPFTEKSKIKWRKSPFRSPSITLDSYREQSEREPELPIKYFDRYISKEFCQEVATYTNMYAEQKGRTFKHTVLQEIQNLLAVHILMGSLKYPRVDFYWSTSLSVRTIRETLTKNRFYALRQNLYLQNNMEISGNNTDKLIKVRPIYKEVLERCRQLKLEKCLCIDEQIVPFKGRLSIKQYMKGKPNPWGVKLFMLCGRSGLVYDFLMYQGSTTEIDAGILKKYGLGAGVVIHLTESRLRDNQGHILAFDNFFTSYNLLEYLQYKAINALGTVRVCRFKSPPFLSDKEYKKKVRGFCEEVVSLDEKVILTKWGDNKEVVVASNFIGIGKKDSVERWDKSGRRFVKVDRPEVVKVYNQTMGGVDKTDQLVSLYRIHLQSKKWTLRMIFHAIDLAVVNSWLEYKQDCLNANIADKNVMDLVNFRIRLVDNIIYLNKPVSVNKRGRPSSSKMLLPNPKRATNEPTPLPEIVRDGVGHLPSYDENKEATRCKAANCQKKTHVLCIKCKVHLCFVVKQRNCFRRYHEN